ncbi:MAG: NifB/NifX family molybdenum-iron cluster-binding protein [Magnetospiraceae bacterium]
MTRRLAVLDVSTDEAWMDTALKVAFASSDLKHVDQHFGSASCFVKYAVTPDEAHMAEVVQFEDTDQDGNENKLIAKMDALKDCAAVYVQAVGSSAMTQLRAINVQPVKVSNGTPIGEMIHALREELREGPRSWLARAIAQQRDPDRFSAMEADGWDE